MSNGRFPTLARVSVSDLDVQRLSMVLEIYYRKAGRKREGIGGEAREKERVRGKEERREERRRQRERREERRQREVRGKRTKE